LDGVTKASDRYGFAQLTVERVLDLAEVSRASFYHYFANVAECFRFAYQHHAEQLERAVCAAIRSGGVPELAALDAIASFAIARPAAARLLMREGLAAGPAGLIAREELIARIVSATSATNGRFGVDIPATVFMGGAFRFLAVRLSQGDVAESTADELRAWACAFPAARARRAWSERLTPTFPERPAPLALSSFRPRGSARERIIHGTALSIRAKGYQAITVSDIASAAGVSRRRFYNEFPSKAHAFIAAYELAFQRVLAACTPAFFGSRVWAERVWQAAREFTAFVAREPLLAYLGLVECYALGPDFNLRVHDTQLAFTLFLEDGYRQREHAEALPRAFSALTSATIFEVAFGATRRSAADVRRYQPLAVYIALAPFVGLDEAGEFVLDRLRTSAAVASGGA
jgi:AcrR family transcriptional regulator